MIWVGAKKGVDGTDVVDMMRAATSVKGKVRGDVVRPQPPATWGEANNDSCENWVKARYVVGDVLQIKWAALNVAKMSFSYNSTPFQTQVVGGVQVEVDANEVLVSVTSLPSGYCVVWTWSVVASTVLGM
jgi:hypothetical protein